MNELPLVLIIILVTLSLTSSVYTTTMVEDCTNGLDDDGDGLIDLNDEEDCFCIGTDTIAFTSLIPNSSFERINNCPYDYAQLDFVQDWIQASDATSDYYNLCNFSGDGDLGLYGDPPQPLPNGSGYVGIANASSGIYKEYIGACLNGPILAGQEYTLQLYVGFGSNGRLKPFSPFEINIFGSSLCDNLPFSGEECPIGQDDWEVLGTTTVSGDGTWELVNYEFTPTRNINALIIGPGCTSHHESYYWLDRLQLNQTDSFEGCPAFYSVKNVCGEIELQSDHVDINCNVQWFFNGVAIDGARDRNYTIPDMQAGEYRMMLFDGSVCNLSSSYNYTPTNSQYDIIIDTTLCSNESLLINGDTYSQPGTYEIRSESELGCDTVYHVIIDILPSDLFEIDTVICDRSDLTFMGNVYTSSGIYPVVNSYGNRCDSYLDLNLERMDGVPINRTEVICDGQEVEVGGTTFNEAGLYEIRIESDDNCDTLISLTVMVEDPNPELWISSTVITDDIVSLSLSGVDKNIIEQVEWYGSGEIICPSCIDTDIILSNGLNKISVVIRDQNGCTAQAQIEIFNEVKIDIFIPNVFTPNDDGINDCIILSSELIDINIEEFIIVNRWGDIVFSKFNEILISGACHWNGVYKNVDQPNGVFIYKLRISDSGGNIRELTGDIALIR